MNILVKNGQTFCNDFHFHNVDVKTNGKRIEKVADNLTADGEDMVIDAEGKYVIPGLIDIHSHGCVGHDGCDANLNAYQEMMHYYASFGVTSVLATLVTETEEVQGRACRAIREYMSQEHEGATIQGINMEGPFFSKEKKGAQAEEKLHLPDVEMFRRLNAASGGNIRQVCLAPELEGGMDFIQTVKDEVVVSIAHTTASYDTTLQAIAAGASHVTHLYNAMPAYNHREPGVIGVVYNDDKITAELISDGFHIHPAVVRATFKLMANRICLISDSLAATGMADGDYSLGGQTVYVRNGQCKLKDGTIAGSTTPVMECMRRAVSFGVPFEQALRAATFNPARAMGLIDRCGTLSAGKSADIVLLNRDLSVDKVIINGKVYR